MKTRWTRSRTTAARPRALARPAARGPVRRVLRPVVGALKAVGLVLAVVLVITAVAAVWGSSKVQVERSAAPTVVNDVTQLNPIPVSRIVTPTTTEEVVAAVRAARGPVSIGGGRYSMGGQTATPGGVQLDMRRFNRIVALDRAAKTVTVQSGVRWRQLQEYIDPANLSVKIMQTYANFTVGGSLSVNVHGRYVGLGPLIMSVRRIQVVLADGTVVEATPTQNSEIFYGAIGGYGGLGVIVEATLSLADDVRIERRDTVIPVADYRAFFESTIRDDRNVIFHNADLYPPDFTTARQVSWYETDKPVTIEDRIIAPDAKYTWQPRVASFVARYDAGKWLRQHVLEPLYYSRQRVAWRNWEASYDVAELEPSSREEQTYGLREYFVPVDRFDEFVPRMREIFAKHDANIINVSVRHALPDPGTLLAWAKEEVFAFVVYYRQGRRPQDIANVRAWSLEMIEDLIRQVVRAVSGLRKSRAVPCRLSARRRIFRAKGTGGSGQSLSQSPVATVVSAE